MQTLIMLKADRVDGEDSKFIDYIPWREVKRIRVFRDEQAIEIEFRSGGRSIYQFVSGAAFSATWDDIRQIDEELED